MCAHMCVHVYVYMVYVYVCVDMYVDELVYMCVCARGSPMFTSGAFFEPISLFFLQQGLLRNPEVANLGESNKPVYPGDLVSQLPSAGSVGEAMSAQLFP